MTRPGTTRSATRARRALALLAALPLMALAGCMQPSGHPPSTATRAAQQTLPVLPPMKIFTGTPHMPAPRISNTDLARDFMDLSFQLESGRRLPVFTRFEGPISVGLTGDVPPGLARDLDALVGRLRSEAGLDISRLPVGRPGNVTVHAVSGDDIRRELPAAACFVVPGISKLSEYRRARHRPRTDWTRLDTRDKLAIFVPNDAAPQELRDCLHEELAQALGPLNDLYRLPGSVFNDDNIQTILTPYDMLILRATYAPELHSGMAPQEVAARLPGILARLNPAGAGLPSRGLGPTPPAWRDAIARALGAASSPAARLRGAEQAVAIARGQGWNDHRMAFSTYVLGRMLEGRAPQEALHYLQQAHRIYAARPDTQIHAAHTAVQLAAHALSAGDGARALTLLKGLGAQARAHQNAMLLANIHLLRAAALTQTGHPGQARATRLDSLGWARYGFGPDWAVHARMQEVAALRGSRGTPAR